MPILATQDQCPLSEELSAAESTLRWAISLKQDREEVEARLLRARQGATDSRTALLRPVTSTDCYTRYKLTATRQPPISGHAQSKASVSDDHYMRGAALLTTKEREVLSLLSRNMGNKEIARAMVVSDETIKWHMKNLFSKFISAGRKHIVARANARASGLSAIAAADNQDQQAPT